MSSVAAETKPVLIVGAGPAGLVAALSLAKHGVPVRIVDKLPAFHHATRGTGTQPRSFEIYHFLGLLEDYRRAAHPLPLMRAYKLPGGTEPAKTWNLFERKPATPDRPIVCPVSLIALYLYDSKPYLGQLGYPLVALGQYRLEGIIRDHLAKHGVQVELATELTQLEQDEGGVIATLKKHDTEVEEARVAYVIGADGGRGVTRKLIGAVFEGQTREYDGHVWADVEVEGLSPDFWHVWSQPGRFTVTMRATGDGDGQFHVGIVGQNFDPIDLTDTEKFVNFIYENTDRRDLKFGKFSSMTYWKPKMRMVNKLRSGRVFLVGDAAHIHSPTGGQGLNTSIQDSFNLAWKLALVYKGIASSDLLSSFESERLPVIASMLAITTALYERLIANKDKPEDSKVVESTADMSGFLHWQNSALAQLDLNYRWSPIVYDVRGNGGLDDAALKARAYTGYPGEPVHAGDRAPDAPGLIDLEGKETRLHDIFKPTMHTFLVFTSEVGNAEKDVDSIIQAVQTLPQGTFHVAILGRHNAPAHRDGVVTYKDGAGHAFRLYSIEEGKVTIVAVRPDGYIGAFVYDASGLQTYFSRLNLQL
ncbi:hypothetical protein FKP32DRAFT_1611066 [Trametes sanguinea]|nr:hypothetical protein FKP32DRAFT_1611066 [Trametes sanguinea]